MARLRLSALVLLAGCSQAGAQATPAVATSGIAVPAGWQALPQMAKAAGDAVIADGGTLAGSEAWGETARGCYATWIAVSGASATVERVVSGMALLGTSEVVQTGGLATMKFTKAPYVGRLHARVTTTGVVALACFANEREPAACETQCTALLGGWK